MGQPKAWLPFGDEVQLQRVVRILRRVVFPVAVVAAPEQDLPRLPEDVLAVRDEQEGLGPLAGMAAGLTAVAPYAEAAYVSSCDVPLLKPAFVEAVIERIESFELAIPCEEEYHHPLAAVYRTSLAQRCRELLAAGRRRPLHLVQESRSRVFSVDELRTVDQSLDSLRNANTPEEYAALLTLAGLKPAKMP
jgi:molybdopterin-guanine dinucleotide biosynthesis protein A